MELNTVVLILEMAYISENILHIVVETKTSQYIDGILTTDFWVLLKNYSKTGMIFLDLFCIIPLNVALFSTYNIYTSIFRITRLFQTFYMNHFLKNLESKNRNFSPFIVIFKSFFILACIWHWSSCYWSWVNLCVEEGTDEMTWFSVNHLEHESLIYRYGLALYFSMNIATTAAFPEQFPLNNTERLFFIVLIYVGDACFATAFALISNNTAVFPLKFNEIFKSINRVKLMLQDSKVSNHVLKRMEEYYTYLIKLRQQDQASLLIIKSYITENMYNELRYLKAKPFLCNFPIFNEVKSPIVLREIAEKLQYAMYLPRDYIIFRNDIGEEMYFIIEGNVFVMTPREDAVIAVLKKGNYFGEIALFTQSSKRICSVISGSFCELFVLNKQFLNKILDGHPRIKEIFKQESDRRFNEYRRQSLANKALQMKNEKVPPPKAKSKLGMIGKSMTFKLPTKKKDEDPGLILKKLAPFEKKIDSPTIPEDKLIQNKLTELRLPSVEDERLEQQSPMSSPGGVKKKSIFKKQSNPPNLATMKAGGLRINVKKADDEEKKEDSINLEGSSQLKQPPSLKRNMDFLSPDKIGSPLSGGSRLSPSQISDASGDDSIMKSRKKSPFFKAKVKIMDIDDSDDGNFSFFFDYLFTFLLLKY